MDNSLKLLLKFALIAMTTPLVVNCAHADETINVSLWDKGPTAEMVTNMSMADHGDMTKATMGIRLSKKAVKAGKITFKVKNTASETIHEMLVIPLKQDANPIVDAKQAKIAEETAGSLGEVAETDAGKSGSLTLKLPTGKYLVTCNIAGHYMNGMWTTLTVN
jgi:uncharacterized cupredoxin-like copper-binding protein